MLGKFLRGKKWEPCYKIDLHFKLTSFENKRKIFRRKKYDVVLLSD